MATVRNGPAAPRVPEEEFIRLFKLHKSPQRVAEATGVDVVNVYARRKRLADRGIYLPTVALTPNAQAASNACGEFAARGSAFKSRLHDTVRDGCVIIASDCHYWPGDVPFAHKALLILLKRLKPAIMCLNGDVLDGARISRHDPIDWAKTPKLIDELDECKLRTAEIARAAPNARRYWTLGNHDTRLDRRLATEVGDFEGVPGMSIADHFPDWRMSYSLMLNEALDEPVMIKHAFRGGVHAVYNNTLHAGVSIITGHLHAQLCRPFTDYRGTRYGVDAGCLADVKGEEQFAYTLDNALNWRSGFCVASFDNRGRLLPPELAEVQNFRDSRRVVFRGEVVVEESLQPASLFDSEIEAEKPSRLIAAPTQKAKAARRHARAKQVSCD